MIGVVCAALCAAAAPAAPQGESSRPAASPRRFDVRDAHALETAEKLASIADLLGGAAYPAVDLAIAGGLLARDGGPGAVAGDRAAFAARLAAVDRASLAALAAATTWRLGTQHVDALGAPAGAFMVVNAQSFERSEGVVVPLLAREGGDAWEIRDSFGRAVPSQRVVDGAVRALAFVAYKVPPHGVRTYRVAPARRDAAAAESAPAADAASEPATRTASRPSSRPVEDEILLENESLRAAVDARTGRLASLRRLPTGREILARRDAAGRSDARAETSPSLEVCTLERGPVRTVVRVGREAAESRTSGGRRGGVDYVLWRRVERLELIARRDPALDGRSFVAFPLAAATAAEGDAPTAAPAPRGDEASARGVAWIDVAHGVEGVVLLAAAAGGIALRDGVLGADRDVPTTPSSRAEVYALAPRAGERPAGEASRRLRSFADPLRVVRVRPDEREPRSEPPELGPRKDELGRASWVTCEDPAVLVTAWRRAADGDGWILRVACDSSEARPATLAFSFDVASAEAVDAEERSGAPLKVVDGRLVDVVVPTSRPAHLRLRAP